MNPIPACYERIDPPEEDGLKVYCPICGHRLDGETVYEDRKTGEPLGCEYCIKEVEWEDYAERLADWRE